MELQRLTSEIESSAKTIIKEVSDINLMEILINNYVISENVNGLKELMLGIYQVVFHGFNASKNFASFLKILIIQTAEDRFKLNETLRIFASSKDEPSTVEQHFQFILKTVSLESGLMKLCEIINSIFTSPQKKNFYESTSFFITEKNNYNLIKLEGVVLKKLFGFQFNLNYSIQFINSFWNIKELLSQDLEAIQLKKKKRKKKKLVSKVVMIENPNIVSSSIDDRNNSLLLLSPSSISNSVSSFVSPSHSNSKEINANGNASGKKEREEANKNWGSFVERMLKPTDTELTIKHQLKSTILNTNTDTDASSSTISNTNQREDSEDNYDPFTLELNHDSDSNTNTNKEGNTSNDSSSTIFQSDPITDSKSDSITTNSTTEEQLKQEKEEIKEETETETKLSALSHLLNQFSTKLQEIDNNTNANPVTNNTVLNINTKDENKQGVKEGVEGENEGARVEDKIKKEEERLWRSVITEQDIDKALKVGTIESEHFLLHLLRSSTSSSPSSSSSNTNPHTTKNKQRKNKDKNNRKTRILTSNNLVEYPISREKTAVEFENEYESGTSSSDDDTTHAGSYSETESENEGSATALSKNSTTTTNSNNSTKPAIIPLHRSSPSTLLVSPSLSIDLILKSEESLRRKQVRNHLYSSSSLPTLPSIHSLHSSPHPSEAGIASKGVEGAGVGVGVEEGNGVKTSGLDKIKEDQWRYGKECEGCKGKLKLRKRHHCRKCGGNFCSVCCFRKETLVDTKTGKMYKYPSLICNSCWSSLVDCKLQSSHSLVLSSSSS